MPTSLSPTDYCNLALSRVGCLGISSLGDLTSQSAITCNLNFPLAYLVVSRASQWNCLLQAANLTQQVQTPLPTPPGSSNGLPPVPSTVPNWAPNTAYPANQWLQFTGYLYITTIAYTSSNNFLNDLTTGALIQSNQVATGPFYPNGSGATYPSGWGFQYQLPDDFLLLGILNDNEVWDWKANVGDDYEIMGPSLFCNQSQAVIKYVQNVADTTKFDPLFGECLVLKLAGMIATPLKQDSGRMEAQFEAAYRVKLSEAMQRNGGERRRKRPNLVPSSRFIRSRFSGGIGWNNG